MRIRRVRFRTIRFHWVFVPGIIFVPLAFGGFVVFRNINLPNLGPQRILARATVPRTITPRRITPRTITPRRITPQQLTPARNLVGGWRGNAKYVFHQTPISFCYYNFLVDLTIAAQNGNNINGNVTTSFISSEQHGNFNCAVPPNNNNAFAGTVAGSRLTINAGNDLGNFTGSFTTDTITLNQSLNGDNDGVVGSVNLLRQ